MRAYALASLALLAACSSPAPVQNAADDNIIVPADEAATDNAAEPARDYTGRWTGVEGMYLIVSAGSSPGRYRLEMQWDLDHKGSFDGTAEGDGIAFTRAGVREVLKPSDGAATGLKYLAGKHDCLTVKPAEGYCRD